MPTFKRRDQEEFEKAKDLLEAGPAGEMGFVKSLFFGRLKLDSVMPYPKQDADEAARTDALIAKVDAFLKESVDGFQIDLEERIPQHVIDGLGKLGVLGMTVPGAGAHRGPLRLDRRGRRRPPVDRPQGPGAHGQRAAEEDFPA
jgi:hypothetical protein